jgi:polar amino acid transport system ATP-binding protein
MNSPMIHALDVHKRFGCGGSAAAAFRSTWARARFWRSSVPRVPARAPFLRCLNHLETIDHGHIDIEGETLVGADEKGRICRYVADSRVAAYLPQDGHGLPALQSVSASDRAARTSSRRR